MDILKNDVKAILGKIFEMKLKENKRCYVSAFRVNYMSPPLNRGGPLLVVAWFAHAQSDRYFSIEEKYQSVSFL